jgi:hypothetical protein
VEDLAAGRGVRATACSTGRAVYGGGAGEVSAGWPVAGAGPPARPLRRLPDRRGVGQGGGGAVGPSQGSAAAET